MARKSSAIEVNNFVGGLITEASPLTFPANASIDEANFVLNRDGSRQRRLGMDFEDGFSIISTSAVPTQGVDLAVSTYRWVDVAGDNNLQLAVVQTGNVLKFFNINRDPLSGLPIYSYEIVGLENNVLVSYANADGVLVVATGQNGVIVFSYETGQIVASISYLLTRDLFGVEDVVDGVDLREGSNISTRPTTLTDAHLYNLRNQSWALPARNGPYEDKRDNIRSFWLEEDYHKYPANSDLATASMFPDASDDHDRVGERFHAPAAIQNDPDSTDAPRGFFIIDVLNRGQSRLEEYIKYQERFEDEGLNGGSAIYYGITSLPVDQTLGGPSVVEGFAGRVCYAGFNGNLSGGDKHSPKLSSYVFISRLVEDPTDINKCYQKGDPTTTTESDLIDTDGLFVRISGAKKIKRLINIDSALLIFAENGVWALEGGSEYGFTATNFMVSKVSNSGCEGPYSVVYLDDSVIYWSKDGIYSVGRDERGMLTAQNLTEKTIQSFYNEIGSSDREYCQGFFDTVERKVRWLYNSRPGSVGPSKELIFDVTLGAFYPWTVNPYSGVFPKPAAMIDSPEYTAEVYDDIVLYNGDLVEHEAEQVVVTGSIASSRDRKLFFVTLTEVDPSVSYTFSTYNDDTFYDWASVGGIGVDTEAFLVTGWTPNEDFQRNKQAVYVSYHFRRTEDAVVDVGGDLQLAHQSSCIVQAQWEWANSAESNRWGVPFQAYRLPRQFTVDAAQDTYDTGFEVVTTKNKMRGKGKVLSTYLKSEPGKDLNLLGWSMVLSGNENV